MKKCGCGSRHLDGPKDPGKVILQYPAPDTHTPENPFRSRRRSRRQMTRFLHGILATFVMEDSAYGIDSPF